MKTEGNWRLHPVDLDRLFDRVDEIDLGIGLAVKLAGVSIRQLSYWTEQGHVRSKESKTRKTGAGEGYRTYSRKAIEKVCLIKQALDHGYTLDVAVMKAEVFMNRQAEERAALEEMPEEEIQGKIIAQAGKLEKLAERIRRGLRTYRVSSNLGKMAAKIPGLERLIAFFEAHHHEVLSAKKVAQLTGRQQDDVEPEIWLLAERGFVQWLEYPGANVFRYVPGRTFPFQQAKMEEAAKRAEASLESMPQPKPSAPLFSPSAELVWKGANFRQAVEGLCSIFGCMNGMPGALDLSAIPMRMDIEKLEYKGKAALEALAQEITDQGIWGKETLDLRLGPGCVECTTANFRLVAKLGQVRELGISLALSPDVSAKLSAIPLPSSAIKRGWRKC